MTEEHPPPSFLGSLAADLAEGLRSVERAPEDQDRRDAGPDLASAPESLTEQEPWVPRAAVLPSARNTRTLPPEAQAVAEQLLTRAGRLRANTRWELHATGGDLVRLEPAVPVIVGRNRSQGASVVVSDRIVSRRQCQVELTNRGPEISELGSVNPTHIHRDGSNWPVGEGRCLLRTNDAVSVGGEILLFAIYEVAS